MIISTAFLFRGWGRLTEQPPHRSSFEQYSKHPETYRTAAGWTANSMRSIVKLLVHVNILLAVVVVIFVSNQEIKHESL